MSTNHLKKVISSKNLLDEDLVLLNLVNSSIKGLFKDTLARSGGNSYVKR